MKLICIRHGETQWNVEGREMGQLDSPLTPLGLRQAEAIADRLGKLEFDALYSSDLGRAVQTAEAIASRCGRDIRLDAGLRERNMGIFQGLTLEEMRRGWSLVDQSPRISFITDSSAFFTSAFVQRRVHSPR
jgi:probable phosphoglycerate mutase